MLKTSDYAKMSNEQVVFILDKHSSMAPYSHEFVLGSADPQMLSGFIGAMSNFMEEMTGSEQFQWKTQYGTHSTLLVESGEWTLGVLSVLRETSEVRSKLRRIVHEFEDSFKAMKGARAIEGSAFKEFDNFVKRVFIFGRLTNNSLILKGKDWKESALPYETPSKAFNVTKFLIFANSEQSIGQAARSQKLEENKARELTAQALWNNAIYVKYIPSEDDILALSEGSASILLRKENPLLLSPNTIRIIGALDGRTPLSAFMKIHEMDDVEQLYSELGNLITIGHVHKISIEQRLILVKECILSKFLQLCVNAVGTEKAIDYFTQALMRGIPNHPWVGRIKVMDDMSAHCSLDTRMKPLDLDSIYYALQYLTEEISKDLSRDIGMQFVEETHASIIEQCHYEWEQYIHDGVI